MRKRLLVVVSAVALLLLSADVTHACYVTGYVRCDTNGNGLFDATDKPMPGVVVTVESLDGTYTNTGTTDATGYFTVGVRCEVNTFRETLDAATLPADATIIAPPGGFDQFTLDWPYVHETDWLIDSSTCRAGLCWLTGGGVKYEAITGTRLAERGAKNTFGGNVFPGCSPTAGDGGSWNHVAHDLALHFHGTDIDTVACGNVPGIPPGSESPVTPFNYIEFQGTGWLKGIKGNSADFPLVYFFGRAEDRNEPGSNGAKDGAKIDRYFLHVWLDPGDPVGSTLLLIDGDGNPATIDAVPITNGNLQIHISSCDNPPF